MKTLASLLSITALSLAAGRAGADGRGPHGAPGQTAPVSVQAYQPPAEPTWPTFDLEGVVGMTDRSLRRVGKYQDPESMALGGVRTGVSFGWLHTGLVVDMASGGGAKATSFAGYLGASLPIFALGQRVQVRVMLRGHAGASVMGAASSGLRRVDDKTSAEVPIIGGFAGLEVVTARGGFASIGVMGRKTTRDAAVSFDQRVGDLYQQDNARTVLGGQYSGVMLSAGFRWDR